MTRKQGLEHDYKNNGLGASVCKRCGHIMSLPDFPPHCPAPVGGELEKAYGGCKKCYGKGYATVISATTWSDTDQDIGSPGGYGKTERSEMRFCSCDRGKQLRSQVARERREAQIEELKKAKEFWFRNTGTTPLDYINPRLDELKSEGSPE